MDMSLSKLREMVKDREPWRAAVHGVTKNWTLLSEGTATISKSYFKCFVWVLLLRSCCFEKLSSLRISMVVRWLRLCTSTAGGKGSLLGQGTEIPHAVGEAKKKKSKKIK